MGKKQLLFSLLVLIISLVLVMGFLFKNTQKSVDTTITKSAGENSLSNSVSITSSDYKPLINPSDFTTKITNKYFTMSIGRKMVYQAETEDGLERIEILIPGWTKTIMGVETLVFWDRVYVDGELIEDTRDYIAQDKEGNVWYFGENVDNYVDGKFLDHHGAWIGGIDGAQPGIWIKANPQVGDEYKQEFYKGEAEDIGRIDNIDVSVKTPLGSFTGCIQVFEWTPLEDATAYKYHCPGIGTTVLEEEENEKVIIVEIDNNAAKCIALPSRYAQEGVKASKTICSTLVKEDVNNNTEILKKDISEQEAKKIAKDHTGGSVTDAEIEKKNGKTVYVVEIKKGSEEIDVFIDIKTGKVIGTES